MAFCVTLFKRAAAASAMCECYAHAPTHMHRYGSVIFVNVPRSVVEAHLALLKPYLKPPQGQGVPVLDMQSMRSDGERVGMAGGGGGVWGVFGAGVTCKVPVSRCLTHLHHTCVLSLPSFPPPSSSTSTSTPTPTYHHQRRPLLLMVVCPAGPSSAPTRSLCRSWMLQT